MFTHHQLPDAPLGRDLALTVGTFDGVHRGHQWLIGTLKSEAQKRGLRAAALTFTDMPYCFFRPDDCPHLLTLAPEKVAAFAPLGVDELFIVPFDEAIARQSAREFVGGVFGNLGVKLLVVGPDFALGRGRDGDVPALRALGAEFGFEVLVLEEKLTDEGRAISSTRVREAVEDGQVQSAARMLGRPFVLAGEVVSGQQLGRTIGVPTINIRPHERKALPKNGVYAARAFFDDETVSHPAALNIGVRPTVDGLKQSIEFHVIGETIETPPRRACLELVARLRDEQKFPGLDALVAQIRADVEQAREILL
jgi:riboflavin kinase / FMN adenylyltransferase